MKAPPKGWPRMSSSVFYDDALAAIDFLRDAFGFEVELVVEHDGRVDHSQLSYGGGMVMVSTAGSTEVKPDANWRQSPRDLGGCSQAIMFYVDDVDAHHARAAAAGAEVIHGPATDDYGEDYWSDRSYMCKDPEGHVWAFCQRLREPKA